MEKIYHLFAFAECEASGFSDYRGSFALIEEAKNFIPPDNEEFLEIQEIVMSLDDGSLKLVASWNYETNKWTMHYTDNVHRCEDTTCIKTKGDLLRGCVGDVCEVQPSFLEAIDLRGLPSLV